MRRTFAIALGASCVFFAKAVFADDAVGLATLLPKLAITSQRIETLVKKASFTMVGHMENVDGDGTVSGKKDGIVRVKNDGNGNSTVEVIRYVEDGQDKTEDARKKAEKREREAKKPKEPDEEIHMPFLGTEQAKYDFRLGEADTADPSRVKIYFTAKRPAQNLLNGSAWVDTKTGEVLTMGVAPSRTPTFVDYLRVTIEFAESTPMGRAVSKIGFEGGGGIWFLRKRFRGTAVFSGYEVH